MTVFTTAAIADQHALLAVIGVILIAVVAVAPGHAVLVAIPVCMMPWDMTYNGLDTRTALVAIIEIGALLGKVKNLRRGQTALTLTIPLGATVLISLYTNPQAVYLPPPYPANNAYTLVLAFLLIPTFAVVRPPGVRTLQVLALSGLLLCLYAMFFGIWYGGRNQLNEALNPNATGHIATVAAVIAIALFTLQKRLVWLAVAAVDITSAVLTQSRGGFIVLTAGTFLIWFVRMRRRTRIPYLLLGAAATIASWPVLQLAQEKLFSLRDQEFLDVSAREHVGQLAIRLAVEHPLTGIGYRVFLDRSAVAVGMALDTHNDYLRLAVECGLPSFALMLAILVTACRRMRAGAGENRVFLVATMAACGVLAFANSMIEFRVSMPAWVLLGLCLTVRAEVSDQSLTTATPQVPDAGSRAPAVAL